MLPSKVLLILKPIYTNDNTNINTNQIEKPSISTADPSRKAPFQNMVRKVFDATLYKEMVTKGIHTINIMPTLLYYYSKNFVSKCIHNFINSMQGIIEGLMSRISDAFHPVRIQVAFVLYHYY